MTSAVEQLTERLVESAVATFDLLSIAIGDRLGYYRALAGGAMTAAQLASATGTAPRYAQEWLEQQAVTGLLTVGGDRFALADGVAAVLTEPDELSFLAPLARQLVAAASLVPAVADGARSGAGVAWSEFGADMRESEAELNRPGYLAQMREWLSAMPDVEARLSRPGARVADIGCGGGWSSIGIARAYPQVRVDGYDLDEPSVELARRNVARAGLADRVSVHCTDCTDLSEASGRYELVTAFECVHDLPYPVPALIAMRTLAEPAGTVLIADMKVAARFSGPGDLVERLMYGFSITTCLPDSMSSPDSATTGTAMRADTLRGYARKAGFSAVEVLDVEHELWRFYRLTP